MPNQSFSTRRLVITAVLIAITIVLSIPLNLGPLISLGYVRFPFAAVTILHVPTIIAAILEGPIIGAIVGAAFGLFSLFLATQPTAGPGDLLFLDPFVSVLPRLLIGPVAWLVYRSLKSFGERVRLSAAAVAGTLTNTILVVTAILIRFPGVFDAAVEASTKAGIPYPIAVASLFVLNAAIEAIVAVVITVAVVSAVRGAAYGKGGSSV